MAFESAQAAVEMKKFIKMANGNSTWDRLAEYLEKDNSGKEIFVINNSFPAPVEKIFKMWTTPQLAELWRPPFEKTSDLKIEKNTALEYTMSFSGLQMKVFTFLAEEEPQQTRITVVCEPPLDSTQKTAQNFISHRPALHQAWSQSFDRLEEQLTKNDTPL